MRSYFRLFTDEPGVGNDLLKAKVLRDITVEYTEYWTRHVRLIRYRNVYNDLYRVETADDEWDERHVTGLASKKHKTNPDGITFANLAEVLGSKVPF